MRTSASLLLTLMSSIIRPIVRIRERRSEAESCASFARVAGACLASRKVVGSFRSRR
jgi:hypothetical protein